MVHPGGEGLLAGSQLWHQVCVCVRLLVHTLQTRKQKYGGRVLSSLSPFFVHLIQSRIPAYGMELPTVNALSKHLSLAKIPPLEKTK